MKENNRYEYSVRDLSLAFRLPIYHRTIPPFTQVVIYLPKILEGYTLANITTLKENLICWVFNHDIKEYVHLHFKFSQDNTSLFFTLMKE